MMRRRWDCDECKLVSSLIESHNNSFSLHFSHFSRIFLIVAIQLTVCDFLPVPDPIHPLTPAPRVIEPSGLYLGPYFDEERNKGNVSAYVGTHAYLPCHVKQLGNKSVSWIRSSDSHIVSVDRYTFIADDRFQVIPFGDAWTLQIRYVQPHDGGVYECQISTSPKLAFRTRLNVLVPKIRINGDEPNVFVWEGSEVKFKCVVENGRGDQLKRIQWLKNDVPLSENGLNTYVLFQNYVDGTSLTSIAKFTHAQKYDSGNYTCALDDVGSTTVTLHVLNGENPAAMQHGYGKLNSANQSNRTHNLQHSYHLLFSIFVLMATYLSSYFTVLL